MSDKSHPSYVPYTIPYTGSGGGHVEGGAYIPAAETGNATAQLSHMSHPYGYCQSHQFVSAPCTYQDRVDIEPMRHDPPCMSSGNPAAHTTQLPPEAVRRFSSSGIVDAHPTGIIRVPTNEEPTAVFNGRRVSLGKINTSASRTGAADRSTVAAARRHSAQQSTSNLPPSGLNCNMTGVPQIPLSRCRSTSSRPKGGDMAAAEKPDKINVDEAVSCPEDESESNHYF